jgi:hypothetical protein
MLFKDMKTKYKLFKLNLYDSRWLGEYKTIEQARKEKKKIEQEGIGIITIVPTDMLSKDKLKLKR